jgi:hypothetical protein
MALVVKKNKTLNKIVINSFGLMAQVTPLATARKGSGNLGV